MHKFFRRFKSLFARDTGIGSMSGKILVCLDGSKLAEQILPYAMEQALHFDSKVILLRIIPRSPTFPFTGRISLDTKAKEYQRQQIEDAKRYLDQIALRMREKTIDVEGVVLESHSSQHGGEIVNYAHEHEVDIIAIATHGEGGFKRLFVGSVADFIIKESGLPVLVIRPQENQM